MMIEYKQCFFAPFFDLVASFHLHTQETNAGVFVPILKTSKNDSAYPSRVQRQSEFLIVSQRLITRVEGVIFLLEDCRVADSSTFNVPHW